MQYLNIRFGNDERLRGLYQMIVRGDRKDKEMALMIMNNDSLIPDKFIAWAELWFMKHPI